MSNPEISSAFGTLNLSTPCTPDQVKRAYRSLVLEHHPDKSGNVDTTERFQQIQAAYETLEEAGLPFKHTSTHAHSHGETI